MQDIAQQEGSDFEFYHSDLEETTNLIPPKQLKVQTNEKVASDLHQARDLIGGFGKLQYFVTFCAVLSDMRLNGVLFSLAAYELQPSYQCFDQQSQTWYQCDPATFCADRTVQHRIDYSNPESINSLYDRIDLGCQDRKTIGLIGSAIFIGVALGSLIFTRLSDIYGRKYFSQAGNIMFLVFYGTLPYLRSIEATLVAFFMVGIAISLGFVIQCFYLFEMVPKESRTAFFVVTAILGRLWLLVLIGTLRYMQDDSYWIQANFFVQLAQVIALQMVPESAEFYYAKGRYAESKEVLLSIARFNGVDVEPIQISFPERKTYQTDRSKSEEAQLHCEGTLLQMLSDQPLVKNLLKVMSLYCLSQLGLYISQLLIKYLPGDFYLNECFTFSAQLAVGPCVLLISRHFDQRRILTVFYAMLTLGCCLLLTLEMDESQENLWMLATSLVLIGIGSFGSMSSLYLVHQNLFPSVFTTTTVGLCQIAGRVSAIFAPLIAEQQQPIPERTLVVLGVLAFTISLFVENKTQTFY